MKGIRERARELEKGKRCEGHEKDEEKKKVGRAIGETAKEVWREQKREIMI